ncbi:uncharacterized protein LOC128557387 [Mercenaria mercenaria]|uniref:uncharacterized protein LOC128557387 n=1 Tax=Mercenaria mercenaria TaxID=6596 RepID=UPI00234E373D|nr:uncharacterized protein LOC128557387 [Mercenaria mercenaria]
MDTFESILRLVSPDCFMASVDLQDAYYSVFIAEEDQVKLRFEHRGILYQYQALPNGISFAPRLFTKLMKPIYASLRVRGYKNSGYIDDSFLSGNTFLECEQNVKDTVSLMSDVGFMINKKKSVLIPTRKITFLGNDIDSEKMVVTLPQKKVFTLLEECKQLHRKSKVSIQNVARVLGLMVSSFSAVEFGHLFYRKIEKEKIQALKNSKGDFSSKMYVTDEMRTELKWWIDNLSSQERVIDHGNADLVIVTDASSFGWAGICENQEIGGRWTTAEAGHHINYLELLAASLSVKAFCMHKKNIHVQVQLDNTCAVSYIRNMGGCRSLECNDLVHKLWVWCMGRSVWLSSTHIPGKDNISDHGSRNFNDNVEWKLNEQIFDNVTSIWGKPEVDMFASRLNCQLPKYVSWKPDAEAFFVDAFSLDWSKMFMYIFCPFSLVARALQKLRQDQGDCIMIVPLWPTQNWWNDLLELLIDIPYIIPVTSKVLQIPYTDKVHPLVGKLNLVASRLSGNLSKIETFQRELQTLSCPRGNLQHKSSTQFTLRDGFSSVVKNKLIQFKLL